MVMLFFRLIMIAICFYFRLLHLGHRLSVIAFLFWALHNLFLQFRHYLEVVLDVNTSYFARHAFFALVVIIMTMMIVFIIHKVHNLKGFDFLQLTLTSFLTVGMRVLVIIITVAVTVSQDYSVDN